MPADYDFVILGYSETGIYAAIEAARKRARVAIVEQNCQPKFPQLQVLSNFAKTLDQVNRSRSFFDSDVRSLNFELLDLYLQSVTRSHQEFYDPAKLASLGIEFIAGAGEFCRKPQPGFIVNGRMLRSRSYLIATDYSPAIPDPPGLSTVDYRTADQLLLTVPNSIAIIGDDPIGAELAQIYARLGSQVTIILRQPHLFTMADSEAAFLVQASLEAEGIRIINALHINQIRQVGSKKAIDIENYTIEADELFITVGWQPNVSNLNLEAMDIQEPIQLNNRLQTTDPRVYWITHPIQSIARYQTDVVLNNLTSLSLFKVDYDRAIQSVATEPEFAWIGLTETQALRRYRKDVLVLRQPFNQLLQAQITGDTTGLCKLIVRRSGEILGAHIVGANAIELINTISFAMSENLKVQFFDRFTPASPAFSEVLRNAAQEWRVLTRNNFVQDLRESYLAWRRERMK
jgi:pyruvate/2-oxoglutarate dehydrogenase complex dihydrolipoamide dehydrogenase (E3) component